MKKKLLSMVLALALVLGVVAVPAFSSDAASKATYTKVTMNDAATDLTFVVSSAKREKAAKALNSLISDYMPKGTNFQLTINGVEYTAYKYTKQGKGNVYVWPSAEEKTDNGLTLVNLIKANEGTSTEVTVSVNLNKAFKIVKIAKKKVSYGYTVKFGSSKVTNFKMTKKKLMSFKYNGKAYTGYLYKGNLYVKGNKVKALKGLKTDGVAKSVKKVKVKTSSLTK